MQWHCTVSLHLILNPYPISATVCEADQSEHLWPTLCLLTKSKMAAITGTQWRGKVRVPKVFNSSIRAKTYSDASPFPCIFLSPHDGSVIPSFLLCPLLFSLFPFSLTINRQPSPKSKQTFPCVGVACFFRNNNNVLHLPDLIRELQWKIKITNNQRESIPLSCSL